MGEGLLDCLCGGEEFLDCLYGGEVGSPHPYPYRLLGCLYGREGLGRLTSTSGMWVISIISLSYEPSNSGLVGEGLLGRGGEGLLDRGGEGFLNRGGEVLDRGGEGLLDRGGAGLLDRGGDHP